MRSEENVSATAPDAVPSQKGGECIRTKITFPASIRKNGNSFMITVRREYVEKMSFLFDCRCFFGTIGKVLKREGVVEGGTGELEKQAEQEQIGAGT